MTDIKYCMRDLKKDIEYIKNNLVEIKLCLYGDRSDPEAVGLVDIVGNNTKFRKRITKFFAITWGIIIYPTIQFFYNLFKTN